VPRAFTPESLSLRVQQWGALALDALPPGLQVRLSGKPPITIDGDTLAPEVQLGLAVLALRREPRPETLRPAESREARKHLAAVYAGRRFEVGAVEDLQLPGGAGRLRARHYAPRELGDPHPLLVYYHGGGFTYGDLETHDATCRLLCRHAGAHVLAIDYRLAPEDPFPAAVEDARAALAWACANAESLGADPG
jgi:acetyl esterase